MESKVIVCNRWRGFGLLPPAALLLFSGCQPLQQAQLEKQVEGVANSVQKTTAAAVERTLQETLIASQTGGATLRVKTALGVSSRLHGAQINVELQGQKIILSGRVQNGEQKRIALDIARNTLDPKFQVVNRLSAPSYSNRKPPGHEQTRRSAR